MTVLDAELRDILERAHEELVGKLAAIVGQEEAGRCDRLEDLITGGLIGAAPTSLNYEREKSRLRQLLQDIERSLGERPSSVEPWMVPHLEGAKAT